MSDKDYILVDGLPEELKLDHTVEDVLDLVERHHLEAEFRVIMANEPLMEYLMDTYSNEQKTMSVLAYLYVYVKFAERGIEFSIKRISDELGELRPDEFWLDGFYQANMSIATLISEVQSMNRLRDSKIIKISKNVFPSVSCEIHGRIFGEDNDVRDLA